MTYASQKALGIAILGSTGTIGVNTLDVISRYPDQFKVFALTANTDTNKIFHQCEIYRPAYAVMTDIDCAEILQEKIKHAGIETTVLAGKQALETVAAHPETDYVMAAIVGAAGLLPTLAAAKAGKRILLANKESLVMSGQIFMDVIREHHASLLPIDSEHNAIFQCMPVLHGDGFLAKGVEKILLTASGGPFLHTPLSELPKVTPAQAVAHPTWKMGRKISVDSATMMNKGLEVVEAHWLFGARAEQIQVVIHPESIVHSMVTYADGSVLAQMGNPDMRTPIAYALAWPNRIASGVEPLDICAVGQLNFQHADLNRFPCLRLAYECLRASGTACTVLNAANEIAVAHFLAEKIRYTDIPLVIEQTLETCKVRAASSIEVILEEDAHGRRVAEEKIRLLH